MNLRDQKLNFDSNIRGGGQTSVKSDTVICGWSLSLLPELIWTMTLPHFYGGVFLCKFVKYSQMVGPYLSSYGTVHVLILFANNASQQGFQQRKIVFLSS